MSWDEMEDLLCSMEMILSFRWDVADVSKTTLTIIICKIDSLLTEIFKNSVCQDIFGAEEVEKIVRTCHMDIFENIQLCLLNTNTVFEKYFRWCSIYQNINYLTFLNICSINQKDIEVSQSYWGHGTVNKIL